jgi:di/tripeptidase
MELLKNLYKINSKSGKEAAIKAFVQGYLAHMDVDIRADESGNLFITKGVAESYPCIVAHLDEVHDVKERQVVVEGDMIYATDKAGSRVGLGADDKNGGWMALRLLEQKPLLKVALFVDEEKLNGEAGCRGSRFCNLAEFDNAMCLLQCDKRGATEVVSVGKGDIRLCEEGFIPQDILDRYGYQYTVGGRTDVVALRERGLDKNCCNISCGYYNAHKEDEYTLFSELDNALGFVSHVVDYFLKK